MSGTAIPAERIERSILVLRGRKVLLDADLAKLYGVETKVLLQALKRNPDRFPKDFMFQLTDQEFRDLRSRFVTSSWGGRRYAPYVFTEQGVAMLSSVLNSPRAIAVNDHARLRAAARDDRRQQGIGQTPGRARSQNREKALHSRPDNRRDSGCHPRAHACARAYKKATHWFCAE